MQINQGVQKARLISKEIGKIITKQEKVLCPKEAKFMDEVLLTNKNGQEVKITSFRNSKKQLIQRTFSKEDSNYIRNYTYGKSHMSNFGGGRLSYMEVNAVLKDKFENVLAASKELINLNRRKSGLSAFWGKLFNKNEKPVITKSKLCQLGFKNGIAEEETSGISQFKNGAQPKYYLCNIKKDSSGFITERKAEAKNCLPQSDLDNEYLPALLYDKQNFRQNVFSQLIKKNGLENRNIKFETEYKGFSTLGSYDDKTMVLNCAPLWRTQHETVDTIAHEVEHARQHKEIDLLKEGLLDGERAKKAETYKKEFESYIDGKYDFSAYQAQETEVKARKKGSEESNILHYLKRNIVDEFTKDGGTLFKKQIDPAITRMILPM